MNIMIFIFNVRQFNWKFLVSELKVVEIWFENDYKIESHKNQILSNPTRQQTRVDCKSHNNNNNNGAESHAIT